MTLSIDIETFSSNDLKTGGVYKYVEAPDFAIILFAYAFDNEPVQIVDLTEGETLDKRVIDALFDSTIVKSAHNAQFEIICIQKHYDIQLDITQWECTMVKCAMMGLPFSLDQVSKILKLKNQKDAIGKNLIRYFCIPCKPTKANNLRSRNSPEHDTEKWQAFCAYCIKDVEAEREIKKRLASYEFSTEEQILWQLDQKINNAGIRIDSTLVENAIRMDIEQREILTAEAIQLTDMENPNSVTQIRKWLNANMDTEEITTLTKKDIPELLKKTDCPNVSRVLSLRQEMSKTSVKKYTAMIAAKCADGRVRGLLQFYGANRTGRWAGRIVQVQNLPKNSIEDLDVCRQLVLSGDLSVFQLCYDGIADKLSQLIRTAFIPSEGCRLIVADFSAIEARVIAWLAQEQWRLDVFTTHGKIYEASGAQMFKVPIDAVTKTSEYRSKAKIAELALGYQGSVNALLKMGAIDMGLNEEELPTIVKLWREANPAIVQCWYKIGECALSAIRQPGKKIVYKIREEATVNFIFEKGLLFIELPSGRKLSYIQPTIKEGKYGPALQYMGMDQTTKQWGKVDTYGGKLVENIVQAIARDCLAHSLIKVDKAEYKISIHVHDEIVCDMNHSSGSLEEVCAIMGESIIWAPTLPLKAEGFECNYYKKD